MTRLIRGWPLTIVLAAVFGLSVGPFYWLAMAATHANSEIFSYPPKFYPGDQLLENTRKLEESIGLLNVLGNTLFVAVVQTAGALVVSLLAGYAFAKFTFKGRDAFFVLLLSTLVIPGGVTIIPIFEMMNDIGLIDSFPALILPSLSVPFGIFLMRQSLLAVPDDLLDAARVDGAGELRVLVQVVVPVMRPVLAALAVFLFLGAWNDFLWPLIALRTPEMHTLPVALASLQATTRTDFGQVMVGTALSALPMMALFLILQKQFISGLLAGATKG
ncbi:carbohydrate ABC transporter permease [Nonomuraea soli]|uniref:Lactose/L-arabinose transport system permease protein n=1 Tax=Nonomuraea soli TaxID=1032476 RepID=A0A7W0HSK9_9ACTN|nr:carbohydrate ABC transporter permease [Nonomuraea soli]MBA2894115.1 lactose/L-arabinose transport system permease protein [Nonomuraea soli]